MVKISAFPKCWLEDLTEGRMDLFDWFERSVFLECDGLEMYEGFLQSREPEYLKKVRFEAEARGMEIPMYCCSPDFTVPKEECLKEIEKQKENIRVSAMLGARYCRVLSGQRRPGLEIEEGITQVVHCISECLAEAERWGVILVIENHYKDGYWLYPEFAQKQAVFLQIVNRIQSDWFGVQYDPSNAIVAGEDPLELLDKVAPLVRTVHASDRYIEPGYDLQEVLSCTGKQGYHPALKHGVVGRGLNDYPAIFKKLVSVGFDGWISIEDGLNGIDDMKASVDFLKTMRDKYFIRG